MSGIKGMFSKKKSEETEQKTEETDAARASCLADIKRVVASNAPHAYPVLCELLGDEEVEPAEDE